MYSYTRHSGLCAQLMNNPQAMQQLMSSPMVQSLFNNPEMLRSMMMMNPQMRELMEV